jgi:formate hydrogenlyase subunit 3/multisubunit Na+/H+ antiporter MnhD subunit
MIPVVGALTVLAAICTAPWVFFRLLTPSTDSKFVFACCSAASAAFGFSEGLLLFYTYLVATAQGDVVAYLAALFQATLFGVLSLFTVGIVLFAVVFVFLSLPSMRHTSKSSRPTYYSVALTMFALGVTLAVNGFRLPTP